MTHEELENYISGFREHQREDIYKQIVDSELLAKAFETAEGKRILSSAVELITSNTIQIVRYCSEGPPAEATTKIYSYANEINTVFKLLNDWAKILIRGNEHKEKAGKI